MRITLGALLLLGWPCVLIASPPAPEHATEMAVKYADGSAVTMSCPEEFRCRFEVQLADGAMHRLPEGAFAEAIRPISSDLGLIDNRDGSFYLFFAVACPPDDSSDNLGWCTAGVTVDDGAIIDVIVMSEPIAEGKLVRNPVFGAAYRERSAVAQRPRSATSSRWVNHSRASNSSWW